MVRVVLVRHAQSEQNAYADEVTERLRRGEVRPSEFFKLIRDADRPGADGGADSPLTPLGQEQARQLAEAWWPLFGAAARERPGRVQVVVSPFLRTLETAAPLMARLATCGVEAVLLPALMEVGGLQDAAELRRLDEVDRLRRAGHHEESVRYLKSLVWTPQGLSAKVIADRFPWARRCTAREALLAGMADERDFRVSMSADQPWWDGGYENPKRSEGRVAALARWIDGPLRERLPSDALVVLFSHGGTIDKILSSLLQRPGGGRSGFSFAGPRNTSVSVLLLPRDDAQARDRPPSAANERSAKPFSVLLELFNDTSHLGMQQVRAWAEGYLLRARL